MSSSNILIVGIQFPVEQFGSISDLENELARSLTVIPTEGSREPEPDSPAFVIVNDDIGNFSLYLAWDMYKMPIGLLTQAYAERLTQLIRLADPARVEIPPKYNAVIAELAPDRSVLRYGLWSDLQYENDTPGIWV